MSEINENLSQLVRRGGIYYGVCGGSVREIMSNLIASLPDILPPSKKTALLQAVMEREALVSTGIENGIALPHPRTPMLESAFDPGSEAGCSCSIKGESPFVSIAFPLCPLDWPSPDGSKVHTVFLIVSESTKQHLRTLTKINFLCQQKDFFNLISTQAAKEKIIAAIEEAESGW